MKSLVLTTFALAACIAQANDSCARVHSKITRAGQQLYAGDLMLEDNVPISVAVGTQAKLDILARRDAKGGTVYEVKLMGMREGQMQQLHTASIRTIAGEMPDFSYDLLSSSVLFVSGARKLDGPCT